MKTPIDIAIIIALREEFETLFGSFTPAPDSSIPPAFGKWYEWHFISRTGRPRKALITFIGAMGPVQAAQFTTRFLGHFEPELLVNVGLSGTLDKTVKLGDLVVATLADLYDDSGKIEEVGGVPYLRPSGLPVRVEDFKRAVENFPFEFRQLHQDWIHGSFENRSKLLAPFLSKIPGSLLGSNSTIHTGHIAAGSVVVQSPAWKKTLAGRDRKYLAVDMESAAIAFSADTAPGQKRCQLLIVRAICDPADERKNELDAVGGIDGGAVRKWAMLNAWSFLEKFLPTADVVVPTSVIDDEPLQIPKGSLVEEVMLHWQQKGSEALNDYNAFFGLCHASGTIAEPLFDHVLRSVENARDRDSVATISGFPGTGKSAVLTCLCLRQLQRYRAGDSRFYPVYINLRCFLLDAIETQQEPKQAAAAFRNALAAGLQPGRLPGSTGLMLIIDGCDEYFRDPAQSALDQELSSIPGRLAHLGKMLRIVGVGRNEQSFVTDHSATTLNWASRLELLALQRVQADSPNLARLLDAYAPIAAHPGFLDLASRMAKLIEKYAIKEVDIFLLSLLEKSLIQGWHQNSPGAGSLYYDFCCERIRQLMGSAILSDSDCEIQLRHLSEKCFTLYVKGGMVDAPEKRATLFSLVLASFPQLHPTIKEFLIAEHLVFKLQEADLADSQLLNCIYPYGINRFVKAIINRDPAVQSKVFQNISSLYKDASIEQQTHLTYILGRLEDRGLRKQARDLLRKFLQRERLDATAPGEPAEPAYRQSLLLERTIYISLIYLEDKEAASEYVGHLLEDPKADDLNRGFHLEYYEDLLRPAAPAPMTASDSLDTDPENTFETLYAKLAVSAPPQKFTGVALLSLHTICSLCVNRHLVGKLAEYKRKKLHELLCQWLSRRMEVTVQQQAYFEMARDLLAQERVSPGAILSDLLKLKRVPRSGWNASRELGRGNIIRSCPNPESVADHTLGCVLIAELLLPDSDPDTAYSKASIKDMLLIHDLAEAYDGDIVAFMRTEEDINHEDLRMRRIAALGSLEIFGSIGNWQGLWDDFAHLKTINGQIANDIDRIENYVELVLRYNGTQDMKGQPKAQIPDAAEWATDLTSKIRSKLGQQILQRLSHPDSQFLSWYATAFRQATMECQKRLPLED